MAQGFCSALYVLTTIPPLPSCIHPLFTPLPSPYHHISMIPVYLSVHCAAIGIPMSPMRWNPSIGLSPLYVLFQHKAQDKLHIEECYYWEKKHGKVFFLQSAHHWNKPILCNLSEKSAGLQCPRSERKRPSSYTQITSISPVFINRTS